MQRLFYVLLILLSAFEIHSQEKVEVNVIPGDFSGKIIVPINNVRIGGGIM